MRGSIYHADISNGLNVRVYSTEPPEIPSEMAGYFFYKGFRDKVMIFKRHLNDILEIC